MLDEAHGSESAPNALQDVGGRVGIRALLLQPHVAVLYLHWRLNFDMCDESHRTERILSSLAANTIAADVPTRASG